MKPRLDTIERQIDYAQQALNYLLENENVIFLASYSVRRGIGWKKFCDFGNKSSAVREILEQIKEVQEERLAMCTNIKFPAIAIFALKNLYDWVDKKQTEVTEKSDLSIQVVSYGSERGTSKIKKAIKNQMKSIGSGK
ncbi:MAG: hypothetical protein M0P33_00075 [Massilibacteroides sp.]|nr:hypothetical protein [Massilibacteroides sp.]